MSEAVVQAAAEEGLDLHPVKAAPVIVGQGERDVGPLVELLLCGLETERGYVRLVGLEHVTGSCREQGT